VAYRLTAALNQRKYPCVGSFTKYSFIACTLHLPSSLFMRFSFFYFI